MDGRGGVFNQPQSQEQLLEISLKESPPLADSTEKYIKDIFFPHPSSKIAKGILGTAPAPWQPFFCTVKRPLSLTQRPKKNSWSLSPLAFSRYY